MRIVDPDVANDDLYDWDTHVAKVRPAGFWTQDRVAVLTRMWNDNIQASEIGLAIGCTKAAAIGKANRLSLTPRRPSDFAPRFRNNRTRNRFWTPERDALLATMWAGGIVAPKIGSTLGTTPQGVRRRAKAIGLDRRMNEARFWTPERNQVLKEGWISGKSATIIGEWIGCTYDAVLSQASAMGLPRREVRFQAGNQYRVERAIRNRAA